jgi:hypothetical protein
LSFETKKTSSGSSFSQARCSIYVYKGETGNIIFNKDVATTGYIDETIDITTSSSYSNVIVEIEVSVTDTFNEWTKINVMDIKLFRQNIIENEYV